MGTLKVNGKIEASGKGSQFTMTKTAATKSTATDQGFGN